MSGHYLDPKNDYAFRRIFGDEKRESLLRHFLNDVLKLKGSHAIKSLKVSDPNQIPQIKGLKHTIVDVRCKDQENREFIIEMQVAGKEEFPQRILHYVAKAIVDQLESGQNYNDLRRVTLLSIVNFPLLKSKKYFANHLVLDEEDGEHLVQDVAFSFLDLTKFHKKLDALQTPTEKWAYFFKHAHQTPIRDIPKPLRDPDIDQAFGVLERMGLSKTEKRLYDSAERARRDRVSEIRKSFNDGKKEGVAEGKKEGEKIGIAKGEKMGIAKERMETAQRLLAMGLDVQQIAQGSGLTVEEIEKLKS